MRFVASRLNNSYLYRVLRAIRSHIEYATQLESLTKVQFSASRMGIRSAYQNSYSDSDIE